MASTNGATAAGLMTTPEFFAAAGFRNRNEFSWFLTKHPELLSLRLRAGAGWLWPESESERVKKMRLDGGAR